MTDRLWELGTVETRQYPFLKLASIKIEIAREMSNPPVPGCVEVWFARGWKDPVTDVWTEDKDMVGIQVLLTGKDYDEFIQLKAGTVGAIGDVTYGFLAGKGRIPAGRCVTHRC